MSNPFEEITERLTSIENRLIDLAVNKETTDLRYLSREEVATLLKVSLPTLNQYTKQGLIQGRKIGTRVLYLESDIDAALKDATSIRYRRVHT